MKPSIFISHAPEDTPAALRIAEALRSGGVEVWVGAAESPGTEAWDASVRKRIKTCALFLPIVSKNTQSLSDGYFRFEWKLAADRTAVIEPGEPFIVPVAIDGIDPGQARVPATFLENPWHGCPLGATTPAWVQHVCEMAEIAARG